jgi:uncharacterized protein YecE (DUF72 family)
MGGEGKAKLYIGTSGWSYPDWAGIVYPRRKKVDELAFIAEYFNAVEINTTFYRPPTAQMTASWVRRTNDAGDFHFTVKLWQRFTHERENPYGAEDVETFKRGIEPLAVSGRLGGVLLQFPWSFSKTEETSDYVGRLAREFGEYNKWIEVRHRSWDEPASYQFFRDAGLGFANIDQPVSKTSIEPSAIATSRSAYVRLHGRNYKAWFDHDAGVNEKYNYLYTEKELGEWVDHIEKLRKQSATLYAFMNNHFRGQAAVNALQLTSWVEGRKVRVPPDLGETYPELKEIARSDKDKTGELF